MRVVVFGGTGYIGRAVVRELAKRGHSVTVVTRERSGPSRDDAVADVRASFAQAGAADVEVVAGDVTDEASLAAALSSLRRPVEAAVCCLATRTGGCQDSFDVDFRATVSCIQAVRGAGAKHFVLLSAVCVQKPQLAFQRAKLLAEAELRHSSGNMAYSIVRPTAFFKSLLGQVEHVKKGAAFVMFGDGSEVKCKPISEEDLASFVADCLWDPAKRNAVLPVGGPGPAISFRQRGLELFRLLGRAPEFVCVPFWVLDAIQGLLDFVAGPRSDLAELGRIGRYYAKESMLVLDSESGQYSEALTPSYGNTSFCDFLRESLAEGRRSELAGQALGAWQLSAFLASALTTTEGAEAMETVAQEGAR